MVKRVTVLFNSFNRKSGVYPVMSPRQTSFGKKLKTPLCKIGELVMVYNMTANNKTAGPRVCFILYIQPSNISTSHIIFKLSTKKLVTTPKCKLKPMVEDIFTIVDEIGRKKGHHDSIFFDLYAIEGGHDNDDS